MNLSYNTTSKDSTTPDFLTVSQLSERFPAFSESGLRYLIFHEKSNGLYLHIRRIGRKVLVDAVGFAQWLNQHKSV